MGYKSISRITGSLFVGARPADGEILQRNGFGLVVLCATEYQPPLYGFSGQIVRLNLEDDGSETPFEALHKACPASRTVANAMRKDIRTLCSCNYGYNRSSLVAALALRRMGFEPNAIVARLRQQRGGFALSNEQYEAALKIGCKS